jgi:hypothetical protein
MRMFGQIKHEVRCSLLNFLFAERVWIVSRRQWAQANLVGFMV